MIKKSIPLRVNAFSIEKQLLIGTHLYEVLLDFRSVDNSFLSLHQKQLDGLVSKAYFEQGQ